MLSPEQVVVLKAVNVFGTPVPTEAITGAFAALPLPGSQKTTVPLPGPFRLKLILRQLTALGLLEESADEEGRPCYSSHPLVSHYFYTGLQDDVAGLHEGVAEHARRELAQYNVRIAGGTGRPVRTRGASTRGSPGRGALPTHRAVLDLLEQAACHSARAGQLVQAFAIYHDNLGGFDHLGATLHDYARGMKIVSLFLDDAVPAALRDRARADSERYQSALRLR